MTMELDRSLEFDATRAEEAFFPALPARPAVCLIEPREERAEPFLIRTQNLQRRLLRLLGPADPTSKRLNLRDFARGIHYRLTGSKFEQTLTYYQLAKKFFPKRYRNLMRFRPPAVLKVNLRNAYPRCYVTRKIQLDQDGAPAGGSYYGPFPSRRAADAFAERVLDLFKVRRCQIRIRRDPAFPGCIYSEMKMCLAPCFGGCTKEEYDVEVNRLVQFLETSGESFWRSRFFCASPKSPASRVPRSKSSATIWYPPRILQMATFPKICRSSRAGFTANRVKARFSSATKTGLIVGFSELVRACWRRPKAIQQEILRQDHRHRTEGAP